MDRLTRLAKSTGVPVVLVGHVTKDGDLAGPRAVEHLVDTVLSFDGDRHHSLRVLTAIKHRFGPAGEVGIFEMRDDGLRAVPDPGPMLLGDRMAGIPGSVVVPVLQGRRPLLVEVQALLGPGAVGTRPRTVGIDAARVALLLAVLARRTEVVVGAAEVFVAAVGGISITEPAVDLGVALAVASAASGTGGAGRPRSSSASWGWPGRSGWCPAPTAAWPRPVEPGSPGHSCRRRCPRTRRRRAWSSTGYVRWPRH